jgi:phosphotransferase system  glucose/maltose/N-acetylglucosamine-specific IIC component
MTGESPGSTAGLLERLLVPSLFVLMAAGLLVAVEYFVDLPPLLIAFTLALLALGLPLFFAAAVATSRAEGIGVMRSIGRGIHATFRVVCDLF